MPGGKCGPCMYAKELLVNAANNLNLSQEIFTYEIYEEQWNNIPTEYRNLVPNNQRNSYPVLFTKDVDGKIIHL